MAPVYAWLFVMATYNTIIQLVYLQAVIPSVEG